MSRVSSGCKRCRQTHQKCVVHAPSKECVRCIDASIDCVFETRTRFKNVTHVPLKGAGAGRGNARFRLSYGRRQQWVEIPRSLRFIEESGDNDTVKEDEVDGALESDSETSISEPLERVGEMPKQSSTHQVYLRASARYNSSTQHTADSGPSAPQQLPESAPSRQVGLSRRSGSYGPGCAASFNSGTTGRSSLAGSNSSLLSKREAYLMRNFVEVISTWLDACDLQRHFASMVPKLALHSPVLLYAIFASSADHQLQIQKNNDETESISYHDECLNLLIPALSQHEDTIDETLLAAVTILRIVEEFSADDRRCHLLGTTRLLNSISCFASSGGLGEACAWLSLRQNSYVAFVNQEPLFTRLVNYQNSAAFIDEDDGSWANRIVFVFAKALTLAFGSEIPSASTSWPQLREETERWFESKPYSFMPTWMDAVNLASDRPFVRPWLLGAPHVVAMQHYHLTKIMIAAFTPQPPLPGFHGLFNRTSTEVRILYLHRENLRLGLQLAFVTLTLLFPKDEVLRNLRIVIGIAQANKTQLIGFFAASHSLSVCKYACLLNLGIGKNGKRCGFLLRNEAERKHAIDLLKEMSERIGWRTSLKRLERQWALEE